MLPLVSSERVIAALLKLACYCPRVADGSHLAICRRVGDRTLTQTVLQGKDPILRGTLSTILKGLEISEQEFMIALGGGYKRAAMRSRKRKTT
jgi:predicted RNA binding protein YcfA (HicA-like mRNA interferase family)